MSKVDPVPGCPKTQAWTERAEARRVLLIRWERGDFRVGGTHWCERHHAYHHTSRIKRGGKNYRYRE